MSTNAIILAAGSGSRLRPYTDDRPKSMVELGGMTLLERQLATLRAAGIQDVTLVVGYRAEAFDRLGLDTVVNPLWETTNMVETLFCAEDRLREDTVVAYADIVYEPRVIGALLASTHDASVIVDRGWRAYWEMRSPNPLDDAETLRLAADGSILEIGNKPTTLDEIEAQYIGLMRFQGNGVDTLKRTRAELGSIRRPWMDRRPLEKAYMTDLLMEMVLRGRAPHAVPIDNGWLEIDTVSDYEKALAMLADNRIATFYELFPPR
ncbi:MAG: phosphocholine cytidylyltransferase family protein [Rhodospirillaceae bacterium]|nr:phosphocholine cytidylyltransferase family protein [Rhodospirillales bacterium]